MNDFYNKSMNFIKFCKMHTECLLCVKRKAHREGRSKLHLQESMPAEWRDRTRQQTLSCNTHKVDRSSEQERGRWDRC